MLYLHVINTHDDSKPVKSIFVEDQDVKTLGKLISLSETDNIIIINEVKKDPKTSFNRIIKIKYVFLNGKLDINYNKKLKINRK